MHWRPQCHAKWKMGSGEFQPLPGIEPISPDSLRLTLTTKPLVRVGWWIKRLHDSSYFATSNRFFAYRTVVLDYSSWISRPESAARHEIPEFLYANLWSIHLDAFDIDWSWNILTLHNFCSLLIEQLIDLEKVRTKNLKFRTDLRDRVMNGWSVTQ